MFKKIYAAYARTTKKLGARAAEFLEKRNKPGAAGVVRDIAEFLPAFSTALVATATAISLMFAVVPGGSFLAASHLWLTITFGIPSICAAIAGLSKAATKITEPYMRKLRGTEINAAGQRVEGPRLVLGGLREAGVKIESLCLNFNPAAATPEETAAFERKMAQTIAAVEPLRKQVKVLDAGTQGASADKYDFVKKITSTTTQTGFAG